MAFLGLFFMLMKVKLLCIRRLVFCLYVVMFNERDFQALESVKNRVSFHLFVHKEEIAGSIYVTLFYN